MKKILSPVVMMLFVLVGLLPAKAQTQLYWSVGSDCVVDIQEGAYYVLEGAAYNPNSLTDYLWGNTTTGTPSYETIYQFKSAGETAEGYKLWRLYWVSEGKYLENPSSSSAAVTYTASKAKAFVFTVLPAVPSELGYKDQLAADPETNLRSYHYNAQDHACTEGCVVIANKNLDSGVRWFEWYPGGYGVMWQQYTTANIWKIFPAEPHPAYDQLCMYMQENGDVADKFEAGDQPGQVPADLVDALKTAVENAQALTNNPDAENSEYEAALQAVIDAIAACENGKILISEGYYVFTNNPSLAGSNLRGEGIATIIDKGTEMHWSKFDVSAGFKAENMKSIWKVTKADNDDHGFYMQNMDTKRYAGGQSSTNSVVPTTQDPQQVYYINRVAGTELYSLDQKEQNASYPALHAQGDGSRIVIWSSDAGASNWALTPVEESVITALEDELKQVKLNNEYATLLSQAKSVYAKGFTYSVDNVSNDGVFTVGDGLVTSGDKFVSNAFETQEGANCSYAGLLDNSFDTYFHSVWSSGDYASFYHCLDMELSEAVDVLVIKYAKRPNDGGGNPYKIHVYASNDTIGNNWTDQGYMYCSYPWSITLSDGNEKASQAGMASTGFDGKYKYVRLSVEETTGMSRTNGNLYWYWSELRAYAGYYDATKSLIEGVPADVRTAFETAIATAEALAEGNATQADYDALEAAYEQFMANFPDPQIVKDLLASAKKQAEGVEEGEGYGYFLPGAKEEIEAVIAQVEPLIKDVMTIEEVNAVRTQLEAALAAFNEKLQKPADGAYVYILSAASDEAVNGKYLYAKNNSESTRGVFCWGEINSDTKDSELNYMWKVIKNENGYSFLNAATGTYMRAMPEPQYYTGMTYEQDNIQLQTTGVGGTFNFIFNDGVYLMAYTDGSSMVSWPEASGADYCAFAFEDVEEATDWLGEYRYNITGDYAQVVSVATDINGYYDNEVKLYSVLGHKDNNIVLKQYATDALIPAGTPFILVPEEGVNTTFFLASTTNLNELTHNVEPVEANGLISTVRSKSLDAGYAYLFEGEMLNTVDNDVIAANSGYFNKVVATDEEGDLLIPFSADVELPTAIQQVIVNGVTKANGVYTIAGVKVRQNNNLQGLPKGLYIVSGKKVLVK